MVLAASSSIVRAQCPSTTWNNPSRTGNWDAAINWNPCIPHYSDTTINVGVANITAIPSPLRLPSSLTIGDGPADLGGLKINVSQLGSNPYLQVDGGDFYIGKYGRGTLSIVNGSHPTLWSHNVYLGAYPGSTGSVNVAGGGIVWNLLSDSRLFVGCTADTSTGGTATFNLQFPAGISIANNSSTIPGIKVGRSGTLGGSGIFQMTGLNEPAVTAKVFGTLAPQTDAGSLFIDGILDLTPSTNTANTIFQVTPQQTIDGVDVYSSGGLGGTANLGGTLTVMMTGHFTVGPSFRLLHTENGLGGTQFQQYSFVSTGNPECVTPAITYPIDNDNVGRDVYLSFTSCASNGGDDNP